MPRRAALDNGDPRRGAAWPGHGRMTVRRAGSPRDRSRRGACRPRAVDELLGESLDSFDGLGHGSGPRSCGRPPRSMPGGPDRHVSQEGPPCASRRSKRSRTWTGAAGLACRAVRAARRHGLPAGMAGGTVGWRGGMSQGHRSGTRSSYDASGRCCIGMEIVQWAVFRLQGFLSRARPCLPGMDPAPEDPEKTEPPWHGEPAPGARRPPPGERAASELQEISDGRAALGFRPATGTGAPDEPPSCSATSRRWGLVQDRCLRKRGPPRFKPRRR